MSDMRPYLWLIPGLPLLASVLIALFGRVMGKQSHWPCIAAVVGSCVVSLIVFLNVYGAAGHAPEHNDHAQVGGEEASAEHEHAAPRPQAIVAYYPWIQAGEVGQTGVRNIDVGLTLRADALTAMMIVMVTFIGGLIAIYSVGYMSHEGSGYPRFFAEVSLFIAAMTLLVMADNFIVLYAGWEGVGLCSYLLIGYWFHKPSAALAARKAFLVTRIGDVGLFLGILLLWATYGTMNFYSAPDGSSLGIFDAVAHQEEHGTLNAAMLWTACLLLFCGAAGKSAQFPLHVWLPDAMEGPTPVSALIHAATMVTAGVYLVARCTPLFERAPEAQVVVGCIGGFTAILAALIALTQNDLKRVLAYSTLSQLGYMFLALGCGQAAGGDGLVTFAVIAAMFHLFTHAFFKALLFLSAGSVMHGMGDVIDMRRFSGLRQVMPVTHRTFLVGALALAGFPLLSGFWSKDEILTAAHEASHTHPYGTVYLVLLVVGLVTAGLTAFYTFRAYFMTFWGELRVPPEADQPHGHHDEAHGAEHHGSHGGHGTAHAPAHPAPAAPASHGPRSSYENPQVMTVPLMVLAVFAAGVGLVLGPTKLFEHFLDLTPGLPHDTPPAINYMLMLLSSVIAVGGIAVAWFMYVKQPELPGQLAQGAQTLYQLSLNKFNIDELYNVFIVKPLQGFSLFARVFDQYVVDGIVDLIGHIPGLFGTMFRPIQNGLVQFYALAMVLGLTVFLLALIRSL